jgi:hypothetical protein
MEGLNEQINRPTKLENSEYLETKRESEEIIAKIFGPLAEKPFSDVGTKRVSDESDFRNVSESFA